MSLREFEDQAGRRWAVWETLPATTAANRSRNCSAATARALAAAPSSPIRGATTAIEPRGRVTQGDLGMWDDSQIEGHKRLVRFLKQEGALAATQITHSGRKGSTPRSFDKPGELGPKDAGWQRWQVC